MAKLYYTWSNEGVTAVVTDLVYQKIKRHQQFTQATGMPVILPKPIFTFGRLGINPRKKRFVTGSTKLLEELLKGRKVVKRKFYVPFSTKKELGVHGKEAKETELDFVTSADELVEAFDLL